MKQDEFKDQIKRLMNHFGQDRYSAEVIQTMWGELGILGKDDFAAQVDIFIQESVKTKKPKVPALEDFKNALFSQLGSIKRANIDDLKVKFANCPDCHGTGAVSFYIREKLWMNGSSFQCHCPLGEKLYPSMSKQYPGMERTYISHNERYQLRKDRDGSSLPSEFSNTLLEDFNQEEMSED